MILHEKEFIVQQYYKATINESSLDKIDHPDSRNDWTKEEKARNYRMFQAILANEKALNAVLEYKVIVEHALNLDGNRPDEELLNDHYGERLEFAHILARFSHIFTQEDREYLQEIIKAEQGADEYYSLAVQTEILEDCFEITPSGWNIQEHLEEEGN